MNSRFDHISKGLLSLAVILMFAAAVIADQARANMVDGISQDVEIGEITRTGIFLNEDIFRRIETLPAAIGGIFSLPSEVDMCIDVLKPGNSGTRADHSLAN